MANKTSEKSAPKPLKTYTRVQLACPAPQHVIQWECVIAKSPHLPNLHLPTPTKNKIFDTMKTRIPVHGTIDTRG